MSERELTAEENSMIEDILKSLNSQMRSLMYPMAWSWVYHGYAARCEKCNGVILVKEISSGKKISKPYSKHCENCKNASEIQLNVRGKK